MECAADDSVETCKARIGVNGSEKEVRGIPGDFVALSTVLSAQLEQMKASHVKDEWLVIYKNFHAGFEWLLRHYRETAVEMYDKYTENEEGAREAYLPIMQEALECCDYLDMPVSLMEPISRILQAEKGDNNNRLILEHGFALDFQSPVINNAYNGKYIGSTSNHIFIGNKKDFTLNEDGFKLLRAINDTACFMVSKEYLRMYLKRFTRNKKNAMRLRVSSAALMSEYWKKLSFVELTTISEAKSTDELRSVVTKILTETDLSLFKYLAVLLKVVASVQKDTASKIKETFIETKLKQRLSPSVWHFEYAPALKGIPTSRLWSTISRPELSHKVPKIPFFWEAIKLGAILNECSVTVVRQFCEQMKNGVIAAPEEEVQVDDSKEEYPIVVSGWRVQWLQKHHSYQFEW